MSPYMIAQHAIFWVFPTPITRLAYSPIPSDAYKVAYQEDSKTTWLLSSVSPITWTQIGGPGLSTITNTDGGKRSIGLDLILADFQRIRHGGYTILGTLRIEGELVIL